MINSQYLKTALQNLVTVEQNSAEKCTLNVLVLGVMALTAVISIVNNAPKVLYPCTKLKCL